MKILIANHFPLTGSGSGTYTLNLALQLTKMGHRVTVLTPEHAFDAGYPFTVRNLIFSNGRNKEYDLDFNFPCFTTHPNSRTTFYELTDDQIGEYIAAWDRILAAAVAEQKPDIIHAQHAWVIPYCVSKLAIPYILTVHGTDLMGIRNDERYHDMVHTGVAGASRVISVSICVKEDTLGLLRVPERKIVVIHNGFDAQLFRPKPLDRPQVLARHGVKTDAENLIVFAGKLTHFKGADLLLDAAAIYEKELGLVATVIVGTGDQEEALRRQAAELGLTDLHFLPSAHQTEVADLYNVADLAVVPSRVEPFGMVAVEALACGTPVVATNEGGLTDFINEAVGALVDVDEPRQLAEAVMEMLTSNAKRRLGPHAAAYALENFVWGHVASRVAWIYEEVLHLEV